MNSADTARVLFVDDDSGALESLVRALKALQVAGTFDAATTAGRALELLEADDYFVAVVDLSLDAVSGVESGFDLLKTIAAKHPHCRVIVLTGHSGNEHGIRALQLGAAHFLSKPADIPLLAALIRDGISQSLLRRDFDRVRNEPRRDVCDMLIGESQAIERVREAVLYAAKTNQAVFIAGETGSGKGLCALAMHRFSTRADKHFVRYQPTFGTADMVNSDLFGHVKGAFTGAIEDRRGLIEEAEGGTFFLDEIDELPLETQVALLGVFQDKRFRRVGSPKELQANFRLITACNQDIEHSLQSGRVRRDFFHRVGRFVVHVPPLRERREDLGPLARHIMRRLREQEGLQVYELAAEALARLRAWHWPGNVREFEAVVENAAYRAHFGGRTVVLDADIALGAHAAGAGNAVPPGESFHTAVENFKRTLIEEALKRNGNNQVQAARELKLDRTTMRRILARKEGGSEPEDQ